MTRRKIGDREICQHCNLEIEWHGQKHGWLDRGGNDQCPTTEAKSHRPLGKEGR